MKIGIPIKKNTRDAALVLATLALLASALVAQVKDRRVWAAPPNAAPVLPSGQAGPASSLPANVPINPEDLMKVLQSPRGEKPLLIHVGFHILYTQGHIPGSEYIGPASQEDALNKLRQRVERLPRKRFIVLYCGCCPWDHCPTVNPAYEALHSMGFSRVRVLYLPNNFGRDWMAKGFPVEKGQ